MQGSYPWFGEECFCRRPILVVEDHAIHITEFLTATKLHSPGLLKNITIVCLEKSGPDTNQAADSWLKEFPDVQIASAARPIHDSRSNLPEDRHLQLPATLWQQSSTYHQTIASLIRPGGILLQDIQLSTLSFIPADRWWDSTFLATTVRGMFPQQPPKCLFVSNKRGFAATFGAELLSAGHDPRDVLDKDQLEDHVIASLNKHFRKRFPSLLHWTKISEDSGDEVFGEVPVGNNDLHRTEIESEFDIVLWVDSQSGDRLGGKALNKAMSLTAGGTETETWRQLVDRRLKGELGLEVVDVGRRVIGKDAGKAEATNSAARHIHTLRKRLIQGDSITTAGGQYSLRQNLSVGWIETS